MLSKLALALVAIAITACAGARDQAGGGSALSSSSASSPASKDEIVVRLWDNPQGFDPATLFRIETENVAFNIYSALTTYEPNTGDIVPDLAERWESRDGQTWTFHIRRGVEWQGGYGELTSRDVLYSYNRVLDPATASPYRGEFANVDDVTAPDDYTVVIKLKTPDANFLHQVASYHQGQIVKRDAVEKYGEQYQMNPIGTGPYMLERFVPNSEIILTRHDGYYKGPAKIRKVTFRIIKEDSTAEIALKNKEVDMAGRLTDNSVLARLQNDDKLSLYRADGYAVNLTMFNLDFEPFSKRQVRQAVAHAIDRESIVAATSPLTQKMAESLVPDWMPVYSPDFPKYAFDPARARALLIEAGYPNGFSFKLTGTAAGGLSDSDLLRQDYLSRVGVKMDFDLVETTVYNQRRNRGEFEMSGRLLPAINPDTILFGYLHPANIAPKGLNSARYDNGDVTGLLEQARAEQDTERRLSLYREAQRIALVDLPYLPTAQSGTVWPAWKAVKGVVINKLADVDFWPITVDPA
jgi:peptide/nickel transport system substrate-binding protein